VSGIVVAFRPKPDPDRAVSEMLGEISRHIEGGDLKLAANGLMRLARCLGTQK
jgi:hypothetical protein